jgi:erythromycin esterase
MNDWLRSATHPLRTLEPSDSDYSDLAPLRSVVGDARVVAIGESTHRVHEFYSLRHRFIRYLVTELGFTAVVMESGFPEGLAVNDWVLGGAGSLDTVLADGITYHMGKCAEMRDQLTWMRTHNSTHSRQVRFYGMDIPDSSASALPAVSAGLSFLDTVDPSYAAAVRESLLPLFSYLPTDRTGLAWAAPALYAYMALPSAVRYEMTAKISEFVERVQAMRVVYSGQVDVIHRCLATGRHADAFLAAMASGASRTYAGANVRDAAMAENVEWILGREEKIVLVAANGHIQRWPFSVPPIIPHEMTMVGEHLAASLGDSMVVIATCFGGGELWTHRPPPGARPGHTEICVEPMENVETNSLDALLATADLPLHLLDLRTVPTERFEGVTKIMNGSQPQPIDPLVAFDAAVYIDKVTPWHTWLT